MEDPVWEGHIRKDPFPLIYQMEAEAHTHTQKVGPETTSSSSYKRNARRDLLSYPLTGFGRFDTLLLSPGMICIRYADSVDFWSVAALRNTGNVLKTSTWQFV